MPANDPAIRDHQAWLGYLQPDGLVVSPAALVDAQVLLDRNTLPLQERFLPFVEEVERDDDTILAVTDFARLLREFLEWPDELLFGLDGHQPLPESLSIPLPEFNETLAPSFAFKDTKPKDPDNPWLMLVQSLPLGVDLDQNSAGDDAWKASPSRRFERLLRETKVAIGLLANGTHIRLMYAPKGENSGSITFPLKAMTEVAGRPILAAFHTLLDRYRMLAAPSEARLPALLSKSREYQSRVSTALAQQVLDALYELLRGFQAANERTKGELLRELLERDPDAVYSGLLTVLMRLVFLLFAEDRGLMPTSELYVQHYAIHGLFERLRTDNEHYPDTMDHRYGAWAQLATLFRTVYQGCRHPSFRMPARQGHLFDPDRFLFLEGKTTPDARLPLVSDGTMFRVLDKLLILDGERLSYRTLDVEEIGSVYQTVMGFRLEVTSGSSIAIAGKRKHKGQVAAPTVIKLEDLLESKASDRSKLLRELTEQELSGDAEKALKSAASVDDLLAALERKIARNATPSVVARGAMVLQPTDERRRSGSHYTPRSFTEPIVRTTLRPILERLGEFPTPEQILDLKICDLAVGSAAFLVEACRQLGDELVRAWQHHGERPPIPPDETEELLARRLVAQRCLYGVDRNPMAVDLAKLSLWLATLAKDHPFTFVDHSIRCGDSLVGLTREQITDFHWLQAPKRVFGQEFIESRIRSASAYRKAILEGGDFVSPQLKHEKLELADQALELVRFAGDCVIAAFFSGDKDRQRSEQRDDLLARFTALLKGDVAAAPDDAVRSLRKGAFAVRPFHWEIEFPEAFDRENPGFDAIVGNPPFLGGSKLSSIAGNRYVSWLARAFAESHGKSDLVAYFFRRAFEVVRTGGTFGLIATNTIRQGDTRQTGLRWIRKRRGRVYAADLRRNWPGAAAVVVSVIHVHKGEFADHRPFLLNGIQVEEITAYLFHLGPDDNPANLSVNRAFVHSGTNINGKGFILSPEERIHFIEEDAKSDQRIRPYLGAEEMNESPRSTHCRYAIYMEELDEDEVKKWPSLYRHLSSTVRVQRERSHEDRLRRFWWHYSRPAKELYRALEGMNRVLASGRAGSHISFAFQPKETIFSDSLTLFLFEHYSGFALLQSRVHEVWARFFGSSLKDDNRYIPEDCFETFPFPMRFVDKSFSVVNLCEVRSARFDEGRLK